MRPRFLLSGIDTIQCAYYLAAQGAGGIDFLALRALKERLRDSRNQESEPVRIGNDEFLLAPFGTSSGYPFVLSNADYSIALGEFNNPSFYVTYRSEALWREPAQVLHERFLQWAASAGYVPVRPETLSRVDLSFDYHLPTIDFDEDAFVSLSAKDSQHREDGHIQTFTFGRGDVVLRVYNKVAEIEQQSGKTWFFKLWGMDHDVWRIEWQVRKDVLRRFGIRTYAELEAQVGDLLGYLATEHDTLRVPTPDRNRSRWPLHSLWQDVQQQIAQFNAQGLHRALPPASAIARRIMQIGISIYGYQKQLAALLCVQRRLEYMDEEQARAELGHLLVVAHSPLTWIADVTKRIKRIELGE